MIDAFFIAETKPYESEERSLRVIYPNLSVNIQLVILIDI